MAMKILLTGAESVLGQAFVRAFAAGEIRLEPAFEGPCELVPFPSSRLDVSRLQVERARSYAVLANLGGITP